MMAEVVEVESNNKGLNLMRTVHEEDEDAHSFNNNNNNINNNVHNGSNGDIINNHFHERGSSGGIITSATTTTTPSTPTTITPGGGNGNNHFHRDDNNSMDSYGDEEDNLIDDGGGGDGRSSCASNSSDRHHLVIDVSAVAGDVGRSLGIGSGSSDHRAAKVQRLHLQQQQQQQQQHTQLHQHNPSHNLHHHHHHQQQQQQQQQHQHHQQQAQQLQLQLQVHSQLHGHGGMNHSGGGSAGEEDNNNMGIDDDYSENEMPAEDDSQSENEMEENRQTVREALMNRAFNAAAAAAKFGSGGNTKAAGAPAGGTGTSRSGTGSEMISPSPPGAVAPIGIPSGNIPSLMKNPIVNGHGHRQQQHGERHGHHRSHVGHGHGHSHGHGHGHEPIIKSERKSQPASPLHCDVKPESLATASSLNNIQNSIGNALLNLASLGSLAALQQSIPNLMSGVTGGGNGTGTGTGSNNNHLHHHHSSQNQNLNSSSPQNHLNSPLNLTHSINSSHPNNHPNSRSSPIHNSSTSNTSSSSHLAQYISQNSNNFLSNNSQITNSLTSAAANLAGASGPPGSMPQLILASGQIVQGIQGAQLLIPTSQGIMTQTILTIPLTQPGSPQSLFNSSSPHQQNSIGGSNANNGHSHGHGQGRSHGHGHGHSCNPCSPPVAPAVPPSASPDFSGPAGALPAPLLNLAPHLVSQQMGAHIPMIQEKMGVERGMNGVRNINGRRESSTIITTNSGLSVSSLCPPKLSPCSLGGSSRDSDKCSENDDSDQMVDGINLDEIKEFAKAFKLRRLSLGLTQTQVGQALSVTEGPAYSQSAICSALAWQLAQSQSQSQLSHSNRTSIPQPSMFEKLDITPKSAQKIKPVLERWMKEAEDRYKNGHQNLNEFVGMEPSKKRKRRTSFTPQALEILNTHFERNTHPSGAEITTLAHQLGYEREVIRIWFCNKRQALKNTVRMMSKDSSLM